MPRVRLSRVTIAPGGPQAAAPGGPQRERADREEAVLDQDDGADGAGVPRAPAAREGEGLHTVCQEAGCPNIFECWEDREATFLIGGDQCTRRCDFCQIDTGKPADFDAGEPRRVAESVRTMGLRYATVTGVCRDDLPDEGAWLYAETIRQIHELNPAPASRCWRRTSRETPTYLREVFETRPEVFAHNVETVPRIFNRIRPGFRYDRSLEVLTTRPRRRAGDQVEPDPRHGRDPRRGVRGAGRPARRGHRDHHDHAVPAALAAAPSGRPLGQARRISSSFRPRRPAIGFAGVMSGPLVRSSYRAGRLYRQAMESRDLRVGAG